MRVRWLLVCAAIFCASPASAQHDTTRVADPPLLPAVFGGTAGSAVGAVGGGLLAAVTVDCGPGSDGFCEVAWITLGAGVGSVVGAAYGAHLGARLSGASPSFGRTLRASTAGIFVGAGAAVLLDAIGADAGAVVAFTVSHGTIAGLGAALWQRREQP